MQSEIGTVLIAFNRPDLLMRQVALLPSVLPGPLFCIVDGPRPNCLGEEKFVDQCLAIFKNLSDGYDVRINSSTVNLGCRRRVSTGLSWVFKQVNAAIILEDDCLPDAKFFVFCKAMLSRYKEDSRIFSISGTNFLGEWKSDIQDYHFSRYGGIWGWATWRRAWLHYDDRMELFNDPRFRDACRHQFPNWFQFFKRYQYCKRVAQGGLDSWGYVWSYTRMINSGLTVVPALNLVQNVGFRDDGTHTTEGHSHLSLEATSSSRRLDRPNPFVVADLDYDRRLFWRQSPLRPGSLFRFFRRVVGKKR